MGQVAIVTDSCHYLPPELAAEQDVTVVPLYVNWSLDGERRTDRESDLTDFDAYYAYLRDATEQPTTSQPSIGDFLAAYEPLLDAGRDVVSIHLGAKMSGTLQSARQAREQLVERGIDGDRIAVLDSETACGGQAMVLLAAATAARRGAAVEAVVAHTRAARERLKIWFCLDTLEYLKRSGRVGAARALLGSTLKIKPILTVEAEITPVERVRTASRAFERMVDYMSELREAGNDGWVVQHIQARDTAERMIERGREVFGSEPLFVSEVGPVIGTHVGPGLFGVGGLPTEFVR